MSRDELIPAGEVLKVHGLEGGLVIRFREPFCSLETMPAFLFLKVDGLPVPFPVEESEPFGECSRIFYFEDVNDRDRALRYQGAEVMLEAKYLSETAAEPAAQMTGYRFSDLTSGREGTITGFVDIPGNPLLEVETDGETFLIPAGEDHIETLDPQKKHILFRLPEGIFDAEML